MRTYKVTAECGPQDSDEWYPHCEGDEIQAISQEAAQDIVNARCQEAGTAKDPLWSGAGPYVRPMSYKADILGWADQKIRRANLNAIRSRVHSEWGVQDDDEVLENHIFWQITRQLNWDDDIGTLTIELPAGDTKSGRIEVLSFHERELEVEWINE